MDITISRKHVREGKRICWFVCNSDLINPELRMVGDGVILNEIQRLGWWKAR
jgi:hypothetical protein